MTDEEKQNLEEIVSKVWEIPIEKAYKKLPNEMNELCKEEKLAISFYTQKGDRITNPYLRDGKPDTEGITEAQADLYVKTLSKSLNKLLDTEGTFYRKMVFDDKIYMGKILAGYMEAYAKKIIRTEESFLSTSINDNMLRKSPTDIGIIVKGKRGKDIEKISQKPSEKEILFNQKTRFRVTSVRSRRSFFLTYKFFKFFFTYKNVKFIVKMEEI